MSTFEKANNAESDAELLEDIRAEDENEKKNQEEVSEDVIIELEGKMKNQIVKDEKEAYMLYCEYAHSKGFSVRKDKQYYFQGSEVVREKRFVCYRHGEKDERLRKSSKVSCNHIDTRSKCPAMIIFKRQIPNSPFTVDRFIKEHNHEMASPKKRHLLKSARSITKAKKLVIENMVNLWYKANRNLFLHRRKKKWRGDVLGYSKKDCFNFINQLMKSKVEAGDAQSVVNEFNNRQASESLFYWDVQLDYEGRVANFFREMVDLELTMRFFGDVVSFDTTYRTNKYRMICAPFIGINHQRRI
ncbi:protein FAR1-RELATED SEQUENCE 5-like [Lycium ferocissimum]|uniref:protein FAR1-RELATED SEQUENCE 5-like n=1 Tax=Lycium ferocissimum TaxID=112874 RepID=UPI002815A716|nr:protein FAR1-RELATED SEQUENCE 5-like [Lycium ferocissimum]